MNNKNSSTLKIGVIGYGYWGPNIVRNFYNASNATVACVCDLSPKSLQRVRRNYPLMAVTTNPDDILLSPDIDAVVTWGRTIFQLSTISFRVGPRRSSRRERNM